LRKEHIMKTTNDRMSGGPIAAKVALSFMAVLLYGSIAHGVGTWDPDPLVADFSTPVVIGNGSWPNNSITAGTDIGIDIQGVLSTPQQGTPVAGESAGHDGITFTGRISSPVAPKIKVDVYGYMLMEVAATYDSLGQQSNLYEAEAQGIGKIDGYINKHLGAADPAYSELQNTEAAKARITSTLDTADSKSFMYWYNKTVLLAQGDPAEVEFTFTLTAKVYLMTNCHVAPEATITGRSRTDPDPDKPVGGSVTAWDWDPASQEYQLLGVTPIQ
jgi:hypothetical protein